MSACAHSRRPRGQALVEFALVIPLFLVLVFGIIEAGRFMFAYASLNNAVREGTRYAIVHGSASSCPSGRPVAPNTYACDQLGVNVQNSVKKYAFTFAQSADLVVAEPVYSPNNARGSRVTVKATYMWRPLINLRIQALGTNFSLFPAISIEGTSTDVVNY
jgi:Flp pilus assembly protein TadG